MTQTIELNQSIDVEYDEHESKPDLLLLTNAHKNKSKFVWSIAAIFLIIIESMIIIYIIIASIIEIWPFQCDQDKEPMNSKDHEITVLLLSDIHEDFTNINLLHQYLTNENIQIDQLWISGDSLNMRYDQNDNITLIKQNENTLSNLLTEIKKIHSSPIFVPGNHDVITLFGYFGHNKTEYIAECKNIHNELYKIPNEDNLYIAGFGGSIPAINSIDGSTAWDGYPWNNDTMFANDYTPFIQTIINENVTDKSIVLLTHLGPSLSSTSIDFSGQNQSNYKLTGNDVILDSLLNIHLRDKWLLHVHGHTHNGVGQAWIGKTRIVNPGSLKNTNGHNYGIIKLKQSSIDKSWSVNNVQFKKIQQKNDSRIIDCGVCD